VKYKKIDTADIEALKAICGTDNVYAGEDIHEDFSHDEMDATHYLPEVLVEPATTDEVSRIMKHAWENRIPVTPRGQGTGLSGGSVCLYGGILLTTRNMNRILELDRENLVLTVEPGVLLMDVIAYVEERGLFYPPDPGEKSGSLGGNVNTNAGGMRAVKYGVTRDWVRGLEAVLPDGRIIHTGGKVAKNSSGYALKDLIIGSEGTLAIVTKIELKLIPLPAKAVSLLIPFPDIARAVNTVPAILGLRNIPTAVEFMERELLVQAERYLGKPFPDSSADAYLLVTYDGNHRPAIDAACDEAAELCLEHGALDVFISDTDERNDAIWAARGAFLEALSASTSVLDECDVVAPRSKVADFILLAKELEHRHGVRIRSYGHAGDGNLHIYLMRDDLDEKTWKERSKKIFDEMYARSDELGGQVSGEHGVGYSRKDYMESSVGETSVELMKGIKKTFDPYGILNPGKVGS